MCHTFNSNITYKCKIYTIGRMYGGKGTTRHTYLHKRWGIFINVGKATLGRWGEGVGAHPTLGGLIVTPQPYTSQAGLIVTTQPSPSQPQLKLYIGTTRHHTAPRLLGPRQVLYYYFHLCSCHNNLNNINNYCLFS